MEAGRTGRQLAALVKLRLDTDRNTNETFRLAEKILDDNAILTEEDTPGRRRATEENARLNVALTFAHNRADKLDNEAITKDNEIRILKGRQPTLQDWQRLKNLEAEVNRLDQQIARQESTIKFYQNEFYQKKTIALETLLKGNWAYRTKGDGVDTIDRMRAPLRGHRNRSEFALVHEVGENITAGDEVVLAYPRGEWVWLKVAK